jgi:hypothetical protein
MNAIVSPTVLFQAWIRVIVTQKPEIFRETLPLICGSLTQPGHFALLSPDYGGGAGALL